jgi:hypothetical protein
MPFPPPCGLSFNSTGDRDDASYHTFKDRRLVSIDFAGSGLVLKFFIMAQTSFLGAGKTTLRNHVLPDVVIGGDAAA